MTFLNMKKNLIPMALLALAAVAPTNAKDVDPVVMTINGQKVTRSEFEYFYNKNNDEEVAEKKTFDEYVELFVNYKLKVQEALSRGIDTTQQYIDELKGYRDQLAEPYLQNDSWKQEAVQDILNNRKYEVHAAHILVALDEKASPKKVAEAQAKLDSIKMQIEAGASFDSIARIVSDDPSARQNGGDLGYFSVLQMVYPFEEAAFNTPVGQLAECRSQFGLHLLNIIDKRKADTEEVLVAHIMKMFDRSVPKQIAMKQTEAYIDSLYARLVTGEDFAKMAETSSEDSYTARNGGAYPWLNKRARFPQEWLDVAFSLKPGEISRPFATDYGWHIMKQLDRRAEAPTDSAALAELTTMVDRDPARKAHYRKLLEDKWMQEEGLKFNDKMLSNKNRNKVVMTIGKQKYTLQQYDDFCKAQYGDEASYVPQTTSVDAWKRAMITSYEDANLESKYEDFRHLYKEYHDGILLFDVAGGEVWDKASNDTVGLRNYFAAHRANYSWKEPHFKGAFIECADDELLVTALKKIYDHCSDIQECANQVRSVVLTDSILTPNPKQPRFHIVNGLYSPGDNNTVDRLELKLNVEAKAPRTNMPIQMTYGKVLADGPEEMEDVRSAVVADYQNELESQWCAKLREKFPVVLNQKELDKIRK